MKRTFSFWRPAVFALVFSAVAACSGPRDHAQILMPRLSVPWSESVRILGDSVPGKTFYSDFLMIRDKMTPARWHAVGIHKSMNTLYHAVADSLFGEWKLQPDIVSGRPHVGSVRHLVASGRLGLYVLSSRVGARRRRYVEQHACFGCGRSRSGSVDEIRCVRGTGGCTRRSQHSLYRAGAARRLYFFRRVAG